MWNLELGIRRRGDGDEAETLGLGVAHGAGRAAGGAGQVADAGGAAVHKLTVATVHTVPRVGLGGKGDAVGPKEDMQVARLIHRRPAPGLILAGEDRVQLDLWG